MCVKFLFKQGKKAKWLRKVGESNPLQNQVFLWSSDFFLPYQAIKPSSPLPPSSNMSDLPKNPPETELPTPPENGGTVPSSLATSLATSNISGGGGFNFSGFSALNDSDDDEDDDDHEDNEPMFGHTEEGIDVPPCVVDRINRLLELHERRVNLLEDYKKERAALERKYADIYQPLYDERKAVIIGEKDEEIAEIKGDTTNGKEGESEAHESEADKVVGCPQFWVVAMGHMEVISELIAEQDVDALEYLYDIICEDDEDGGGFTLKFFFNTNPYFSNPILTKSYEIPNLYLEDEPVIEKVEGCKILWKDGKCLTETSVTKKERKKSGRGKGQVRTVRSTERCESFFWFFTPPKMPEEYLEMEEEEADAMEEAFDQDYDVAQSFRCHLVRDAVTWFTGDAAGDDDDYDEEDDDESDSSEDEGILKRTLLNLKGKIGEIQTETGEINKKDSTPFPPQPPNADNPECKQS